MGGACGDLVASVIDSVGTELNSNGTLLIPKDRAWLKKPHLFVDDVEKDQYISEVTAKSISSHDYYYHVRKKHDIICIGIFDKPSALWAAVRFKELHRPEVWEKMTDSCGAETIDDYANMYLHTTTKMTKLNQPKVIDLADILKGNLITVLKQYTDNSLNVDLYNQWKEKNQL
jgi:hypothetical protein